MQLGMAQRHAVRIAAKKLRYATEFFAELYEAGQVEGYVNALAGLQDALGALNDVATAHRLLASLHMPRSSAAQSEAVGIVRGWLACRAARLSVSLGEPWEALSAAGTFLGK